MGGENGGGVCVTIFILLIEYKRCTVLEHRTHSNIDHARTYACELTTKINKEKNTS